ncbi:SDR family NAD(P)-dependent oxidoreductase [Euzebya sp.]|uniref:SDR family NAD(P)-dependent oxidoreductase n=1 Tax=Euzebya sp. TaxID=1971409 RepID=UPI003513428B
MSQPTDETRLDGKAVVVTGAGRGLGAAYALACAAAGAAVVVNDIDGDAVEEVVGTITDAGGTAMAAVGSVATAESAAAVVDRCAAELGAVDGLVANAGIFPEGPPWEITPEQVEACTATNVVGVLACGTRAISHMVSQGRGGSIVTVTSGAALGMPAMSLYAASKGAVLSATWAWATDTGGTGIRVNAISPLARTPMVEASPSGRGRVDPSHRPEDVAPLVVALLSDATAPITGQVVRFDGRTLSTLSPPAFDGPGVTRPAWEAAEVAAALAGLSTDDDR